MTYFLTTSMDRLKIIIRFIIIDAHTKLSSLCPIIYRFPGFLRTTYINFYHLNFHAVKEYPKHKKLRSIFIRYINYYFLV